jgi:Protein of unknown function (DUF1360)
MCISVYRATRLVTSDEFPPVKIPREAIVMYLYPEYAEDRAKAVAHKPHLGIFGKSLAYLMLCEWCMSVWVSLAFTLAIWHWTSWFTHWMTATLFGITAAAFTGTFSQWFEKITEETTNEH